MNAAKNPQIGVLYKASARDERSLQFDLDDEVFGYLAQQAVEKLLKVLITAHGERYAFTHELPKLVTQLESLGETLQPLPLGWKDLTEYALGARYDVGFEITAETRAEMRTAIAALRAFVDRRMTELAAAGTQVKNP